MAIFPFCWFEWGDGVMEQTLSSITGSFGFLLLLYKVVRSRSVEGL